MKQLQTSNDFTRLTKRQLVDLFRRISLQSSGVCDYALFQDVIMFKLGICSDIELCRRTFDFADEEHKGFLHERAFLIAYDVIFNHYLYSLNREVRDSVVVRATRYGFSSIHQTFIFEVIRGTADELREKTTYSFDFSKSIRSASDGVLKQVMPIHGGDIESLAASIRLDHEMNLSKGSSIRWWVQLSSSSSSSRSLARCLLALGLSPRLPQAEDVAQHASIKQQYVLDNANKRVVAVQSLTLEYQTLFPINIPVVRLFSPSDSSLYKYFMERIPIYLSQISRASDDLQSELKAATDYSSKNDALVRADDGHFIDLNLMDDDGDNKPLLQRNINRIHSSTMSDKDVGSRSHQGTFLLSAADLQLRQPALSRHTLSCSLLKFEGGVLFA